MCEYTSTQIYQASCYNFVGLDKRSSRWTTIDADANTVSDFPSLSEGQIRDLTISVYQLKSAKSYAAEHLADDGLFQILVSTDIPNIVSADSEPAYIIQKVFVVDKIRNQNQVVVLYL